MLQIQDSRNGHFKDAKYSGHLVFHHVWRPNTKEKQEQFDLPENIAQICF